MNLTTYKFWNLTLWHNLFQTTADCLTQGIWKGESCLFLTPVLTLWGSSHIDRHIQRRVIVSSDLAPSFGVICADYRYYVIHRRITYMRACLKSTWENATYAERNCLAGLATKKSSPGTITHLHMWRQDGRHNRFPLNISLVLPLRNAA